MKKLRRNASKKKEVKLSLDILRKVAQEEKDNLIKLGMKPTWENFTMMPYYFSILNEHGQQAIDVFKDLWMETD